MDIEKFDKLLNYIDELGITIERRGRNEVSKEYILNLINIKLEAKKNNRYPLPHSSNEDIVFYTIFAPTVFKMNLKVNDFTLKNIRLSKQEQIIFGKLLKTVDITYYNERFPFHYEIFDPKRTIDLEISNGTRFLELLQKGTELSFSFENYITKQHKAEQILIRFVDDYLTRNKIKEKIIAHIKESFLEEPL